MKYTIGFKWVKVVPDDGRWHGLLDDEFDVINTEIEFCNFYQINFYSKQNIY